MANGVEVANGSAWKKQHTYVALLSIIIAALSVIGRSTMAVFDAGSAKAEDEQKISMLVDKVAYLEDHSERKDVIEPQLADMKHSLEQIQNSQVRQEDVLRELLLKSRRGN